MISVRCFLSVVVAKRWKLRQMNVNSAFLDGDLNEEVYMKIPLVFLQQLPSMYANCTNPYMDFVKLQDSDLPSFLPNYVTMVSCAPMLIILHLPIANMMCSWLF